MTTPVPNPLDNPGVRWLIAYAYQAGRDDQRRNPSAGRVYGRFAETAAEAGTGLSGFWALYERMARGETAPEATREAA